MDVVRVVIGIVCCNVRGVLMDGFIRGIVQRWCRSEIVLFASCVSRRSVSGRRDWNRINRRPHPAPHALLRQTGLKKYARQLTWFLRFFLSFFLLIDSSFSFFLVFFWFALLIEELRVFIPFVFHLRNPVVFGIGLSVSVSPSIVSVGQGSPVTKHADAHSGFRTPGKL